MYIHTGYVDPPDFRKYGFGESVIIYEQEFYTSKEDRRKERINPERFTNIVRRLNELPTTQVILDIETWLEGGRYIGRRQYAEIIHRYVDTIRQFKELLPQHTFGYYGVVPAWAHRDVARSGTEFERWQRENDALAELSASVDYLYPSLYTYNTTLGKWKERVRIIIAKAKEMANGRKIIPFLWPHFHQSSKARRSGMKGLPREFWRGQLEFVYSIADGFVVWNGAYGNRGKWNPRADWWSVLESFVRDKFPEKLKK